MRRVPLFVAAVFLGAALLFLVQPLVAKQLLPRLGGSPAVWNTCVAFFQATLLLGYLYAHTLTRLRLPPWLHLLPLTLALLALPLGIPPSWTPDGHPALWVVRVLTVTVGPPFLVLAASSPLLQDGYARRHTADPYWLYAASNLGSLLGLLAFPFLLEPLLGARHQGWTWSALFVAFALLTLTCTPRRPTDAPASSPPSLRDAARWIGWAFVPSSLILGTTQVISTDLAAIPLLWVIPLALYLLTFVVAFGPRAPRANGWPRFATAGAVGAVVMVRLIDASDPLLLVVAIHLLALTACALLLHLRLAESRPPAEHLTGFYLCLSLGGVLGGAFNAFLAPVVFSGLWEYPLVLVAACAARPGPTLDRRDVLGALALTAALVALEWLWGGAASDDPAIRLAAAGLPAVGLYLLVRRRWGFALGVAVALALPALRPAQQRIYGPVVERVRTFYGVHQVCRDGTRRALLHGSTVHGVQDTDPAWIDEPLAYYGRRGPAGDVFARWRGADRGPVGVIGLGVGSLVAYGDPDDTFTFFELDPEVIRLAQSQFAFLNRARCTVELVPGDGRLRLAERPEHSFGLLVLDAFSSDAIPVHLLTREAFALYARALRPDGVLLLHVSNRYLHLAPVVANALADAGWTGRIRRDGDLTPDQEARGLRASSWIAATRTPDALRSLNQHPHWKPLPPDPHLPLWTDDFSNVLDVLWP